MVPSVLSPVRLQAPGIQAMVKGQPWTVPDNQSARQPPNRALQLESIQTIIQTSNVDTSVPISPISTASEVLPNMPLEYFKHSKVENPKGSINELVNRQGLLVALKIPEVAKISSGGCFDIDNWIFKIVWSHVQHMSLHQLMTNFFRREDRGKYGEHHTSTRGVPDTHHFDDDAGHKGTSNENHRHQEQGRRVRHRCLQQESDQCISTNILAIAQKELPRIKKTIHAMHKQSQTSELIAVDNARASERAQDVNPTSKKLGKDDQLTAVLISQYYAFILISRLQEHLYTVEEENEALCKQIHILQNAAGCVDHQSRSSQLGEGSIHTSEELMHWQRKFEQLKAEKRCLEEEIATLAQRSKDGSAQTAPTVHVTEPFLPLPAANTKKRRRTLEKLEGFLQAASHSQRTSGLRQAKWPRFCAEQSQGRLRADEKCCLPPSPTPSHDSSPFPSFSSSRGVFGDN